MLNDLRCAFRTLTRTPLLTTVIVATLALGVGVTAAIFGVVDALLFKPLPYPAAGRLYAVSLANDKPEGFQYWPYPKYQALVTEQTLFDGLAAYTQQTVTVDVAGQPHRLSAEVVTASYFRLLDVRAARGRTFLDRENDVPSRDAVVMLSDSFWRTHFAADRNVLGKTVAVKGRAYEIVGIAPPGFRGQSGGIDLWLPVMMADDFFYKGAVTTSSAWWLRVVARAKPGLARASLDAQIDALTTRVAAASPARFKAATRNGQERIQLIPFKETKVDPAVSRSFVMLLAAVAFVLLIACANTANLLLGRAVARQREFAVRRALGASTPRVARQIGAESLILAAASGAAGLVVSMWTLGWLAAAKPMNTVGFWSQYASTFDYFDVSLDWRVALFNVAVALLIGALVGIVPARHASRGSLTELLRQGSGASSAGFRRLFSMRSALVLLEIASSLVLLIGAGLVIRSFTTATSADLGFDPRRLTTMTISSTDRKPLAFYQDLLERLRAVPGVEQAALATGAPLSGGTSSGSLTLDGAARQPIRAAMNVVTADFFATFSISLRAGRLLTSDDRGTAPRAAVVSRTLADQAWPGQDAVGQRFKHPFRVAYGDADAWTTVVGVVDDVVYGTLEDPRDPVVYLPLSQPLGSPDAVSLAPATVAVRSSLQPATLAAAVRAQVKAVDPSAPVHDLATMDDRAARITSRYRFSGTMMGALAVLAALLSATGIYAVVAHLVAARTREIGIRMTLGASRRDVVAVVMNGSLKLAIAGVAIGLTGAFATSRLLSGMLFGITARDPWIFTAVPLAMLALAAAASYLPARRALRVDPVLALRQDA